MNAEKVHLITTQKNHRDIEGYRVLNLPAGKRGSKNYFFDPPRFSLCATNLGCGFSRLSHGEGKAAAQARQWSMARLRTS